MNSAIVSQGSGGRKQRQVVAAVAGKASIAYEESIGRYEH